MRASSAQSASSFPASPAPVTSRLRIGFAVPVGELRSKGWQTTSRIGLSYGSIWTYVKKVLNLREKKSEEVYACREGVSVPRKREPRSCKEVAERNTKHGGSSHAH